MKKEASYYTYEENKLMCELCPHYCVIAEGKKGRCLARARYGDKLYSENYGIITSVNLDPIEKKPLKMYKPGSRILSVGSFGCNFKCGFCQNHAISQHIINGRYLSPEELADKAANLKDYGNIGIAYTYNEPTIMYEYVHDTAKIIKEEHGMDNVIVTNGFINQKPLLAVLEYIDAANVDLKSYDQDFYKKICKGGLDEVKDNLKLYYDNCHLEITFLVIGGYNDSTQEIEALCEFIASVSPSIPLHISRFHPAFEFNDKAPTPLETMYEARVIAQKYLENVYLGNMP